MKICRSISEIRALIADLKQTGSVGFVPTMGALHDGHLMLIRRARAQHDSTIVSIFVNPTQFENADDLLLYPRDEASDLAALRAAGVAGVFLPEADAIYPEGAETIVETTQLANVLHGVVRPGHFRGVATVVTKLFNIVQPDAAYFGKKDYQQLAVIRRMVHDLHLPLSIHGIDTVRDHDGVALSSRNVRLSPAQRRAAPVLHTALTEARARLMAGASIEDAADLIAEQIAAEPLARLEAVDMVDAVTFAPVSGHPEGVVGMMLSVAFGDILLIDQMEAEL
ncbi:pantoate--beta-alanine ligase [Thalassococcus sp. S3]|uniref:pantoate--beta-alanine ligase n=1 Tax=Thalassococcus sp. S3 TaxID=2017482 RepID=UPI001023FEFB|nr:pantoate--beta-alanine ligase [Thalassococcus sp. S3]QBF30983.1 pantoate--beta-alanine ligase [Thalassococcus sp. S3]